MSPEELRQIIRWLNDHGFRVVSVQDGRFVIELRE